ncbi:nuA4 complex subunit EAF3-like protein, partial [Trifolium medium]|nr:nuA4 complex subunit EAF3-like protein [Trifolium medium]
MKNTDENIEKQHALDKKQGVDKNVRSGRSAQAKAKSSTGKGYLTVQRKKKYRSTDLI